MKKSLLTESEIARFKKLAGLPLKEGYGSYEEEEMKMKEAEKPALPAPAVSAGPMSPMEGGEDTSMDAEEPAAMEEPNPVEGDQSAQASKIVFSALEKLAADLEAIGISIDVSSDSEGGMEGAEDGSEMDMMDSEEEPSDMEDMEEPEEEEEGEEEESGEEEEEEEEEEGEEEEELKEETLSEAQIVKLVTDRVAARLISEAKMKKDMLKKKLMAKKGKGTEKAAVKETSYASKQGFKPGNAEKGGSFGAKKVGNEYDKKLNKAQAVKGKNTSEAGMKPAAKPSKKVETKKK